MINKDAPDLARWFDGLVVVVTVVILAVVAFAAVYSVVGGMRSDPRRVDVLAKSPTLPEGGTDPHAALATTATELADAWERFGFSGTPSVSLHDGPVLFVGTVESGSCPATVEYVGPPPEDSGVTADLFVRTGHKGGPDCTADANPVTMVVRAPDVDPVRSVFVANETATSPLSGRVELDR